MTKNQGCDLYRLLGEGGELLYVGISLNVAKRMSEHRKDKPWWDDVVEIKRERHSTRKAALRAERVAIQRERPKYNVVHNSRPLPPSSPKLIMPCAECGKNVSDGTGYVHLLGDVAEYRRKAKEWRKAHTDEKGFINGAAFLSSPDEPRWITHHRKCDPDPEGGEYWMDIERINTWYGIASWSAHLSGKSWFSDTSWSQFFYGVERANK